MIECTVKPTPTQPTLRQQTGISLLVVLVMIVIIGAASAAVIRSAMSGEKLTNNIRVQNLAQQYAEAALRFCETEIQKADGSRPRMFIIQLEITIFMGTPKETREFSARSARSERSEKSARSAKNATNAKNAKNKKDYEYLPVLYSRSCVPIRG